MVLRQTCRVFLIVVALTSWGRECICADDTSASFANLVGQLDHQAFHARSSAATALVTAGSSSTGEVAAKLNEALQQGLQHPSLEVRIAVGEINREIEQIRLDRQLACLLNPRCETISLCLPGWDRFSKLAGDDMAARRLYWLTFARYPNQLRELEVGFCEQSTKRLASKIDPYRLPQEDAGGWTVLLLRDIEGPKIPVPNLTSRLAMALGNSAMGPKTGGEPYAGVLERLIDRWLRVHKDDCATRERLLIAMRYGCHDLAAELCEQIFSDASASPSTQVTALLSASTLGRSDIELQTRSRLDDGRTAHVWQLIAARKTKIRTQVRDVALALLLHHHGIDPRLAGFEELQADPLLLFRDHSLGFPDEATRRKSFAAAMRLIPSTESP
jgi:hypothetical protein